MKSSFEQLKRSTMARKRGTLRSVSSRGLLHLLAVLVGAGQEEDVEAVEPLEAGDRVGRDRLVGVPDMRRTVGIGDGRRERIAGLGRHRRNSGSVCRLTALRSR